MSDTPSTPDTDLDLIDLAMRERASDDTDPAELDEYADLFAARGIGPRPDEAPLTTVDDPTGEHTTTPATEPAAADAGAEGEPEEMSAEERQALGEWLRRMQQIPAERVAALDYYLATGELPGAAAAAAPAAPPPAEPEPDPVAAIDFNEIEAAVGKETADALRAIADTAKAQRDDTARTRQMVMSAAQREQAEAQQRALDDITAASAAFAQTHGLDAAAIARIEDRAARLNVLPAFAQAGMTVTDAMTRALDLALRSDDTYLDQLVQQRVQAELAKATDARTQRTERKQLAAQVAGTGGTAPRTVVPIDAKRIAQMTPEERREAMLAEARAAFGSNS